MEQLLQEGTSGIILSGGSSNRFQVENEPWIDKALFEVKHQENLLNRTITNLHKLCDEIIVVVNDNDRKDQYKQIIRSLSKDIHQKTVIVTDNYDYYTEGPILGIISGIRAVHYKKMIVVPIDMPFLSKKILEPLLSAVNNSTMAVPYWHSTGKITPVVFALQTSQAILPLTFLSMMKKCRADDLHRAVPSCSFIAIKAEKQSFAQRIFASLNRQELVTKAFSGSASNINNDFYSSGNSFVKKNSVNRQLIDKLVNFSSQNTFLQFSADQFLTFKELVDELLTKQSYFYCGKFISHFSIHLKLFLENNTLKDSSKHNTFNEIIQKGVTSFRQEAINWEKQTINFLALHAYADAQILAMEIENDFYCQEQIEEITEKIEKLRSSLSLEKKHHHYYSLHRTINERLPDFLAQAKKIMCESELAFNEQNPLYETDFLWNHSFRVGKIAHQLALLEGEDPFIPTVAAILHDIGKFVFGQYHKDSIPEEHHSAKIANQLLAADLSLKEMKAIQKAITALYNDQSECTKHCQIVHDADRLDKLGSMGIANFFIKNTLRGVNLFDSIVKHLSRELTYANASPQTMYTVSAKTLAYNRKGLMMDFYKQLLADLRKYNIGNFRIQSIAFNDTDILLLVPNSCLKCFKGEYLLQLTTKKGVKCKKLIVIYRCNQCTTEYQIAFCLPAIIK